MSTETPDSGWYPKGWVNPADDPDLPWITHADDDHPDPVPPEDRLAEEPAEVTAEDPGTLAEELREAPEDGEEEGPSQARRFVPSAVAGISLTDYSRGPQAKGWGAPCTSARATVALSQARVSVDARIAELISLIMHECEKRGYIFRAADTGAYNCRYISGTTVWSNHAWALAVDVNWQSNPYTTTWSTDIPDWMHNLWNRYGFAWGGDYTGGKRDFMHFEYMGTPQQAVASLTLARAELSGPQVVGAIADCYRRVNGGTLLGKPLFNENPTQGSDPKGRWQAFEKNGAIFWNPAVDRGIAHEVHGLIYTRWAGLNREVGTGFPLTDEMPCADKIGRFNFFERASIFFHPAIGARLVHGAIYEEWSRHNREFGDLGYPVDEEHPVPGSAVQVVQTFQKGTITWDHSTQRATCTVKAA